MPISQGLKTIQIGEDLHARIKVVAAREKLDMRSIVTLGMCEYLRSKAKKPTTVVPPIHSQPRKRGAK